MAARKSLDQSLAEKFVYGESDKTPETKKKELDFAPPEENKSASIASRKEPTKRFTVDLPVSLHKRFSVAAIEADKDKAEIIRQLIEDFLSTQ
ncbi:MAG: hypothetical protein R3D26_18485 [Cyanobacteriota/Melainabacteria group bacterium]